MNEFGEEVLLFDEDDIERGDEQNADVFFVIAASDHFETVV